MWKRKETNNLSKAGSLKGVFSSFFISGVSVTVAHLSFQIGGGGQHLSPLNYDFRGLHLRLFFADKSNLV
jgi:hypothetical protein